MSPADVRIKTYGEVKFVNNDSDVHNIVSDPVDEHTQCPQINQVGILQPGESRLTGVLNLARTCGYHDHLNKTDPKWKGRIVVE
jgi:hypothetical protein